MSEEKTPDGPLTDKEVDKSLKRQFAAEQAILWDTLYELDDVWVMKHDYRDKTRKKYNIKW